MIGAIIGDIVGSTYEFHNTNDYNFELFPKGSSYTDDTICTIAIADAILKGISYKSSLVEWCRKYPHPKGAYGASFSMWIQNPVPYDSFGNGAAMRVSPVGWAFDYALDAFYEAEKTAECSHSHAEGIKGARVIASAVCFFSHNDFTDVKADAQLICKQFYGEDYMERLPKKGEWNETCQGCVPLALHLFSLSKDFEDAIRLAVSYGGDSDTLGAIVGSLAGAHYDIPKEIKEKALSYLPQDMLDVVNEFTDKYC